jgi:hypothetical protein
VNTDANGNGRFPCRQANYKDDDNQDEQNVNHIARAGNDQPPDWAKQNQDQNDYFQKHIEA